MNVTIQQAAHMLQQADHILILPHKSPDGDAMGSALALVLGLCMMGKRAQVLCSDPFPEKYRYMTDLPRQSGYIAAEGKPDFEPGFIVSTDVADTKLLGPIAAVYADRIDLCIDHHPSNTEFAAFSYVEPQAAAASEIVYRILELWGVSLDRCMAECLYTGISTDTGCFRFSNTTADSHRIAARMIELGARTDMINQLMFETKSRGLLRMEGMALNRLEFYFGGRCALLVVTRRMMEESGVHEDELDGIAALPRRIEGVEAGVTMKERAEGGYKVSVRTNSLDASQVCQLMGGGGHARAAGCAISAPLEEAKQMMLQALGTVME